MGENEIRGYIVDGIVYQISFSQGMMLRVNFMDFQLQE